MSFVKYKEVYAAAAEVLGLILQHVTERKHVSAAQCACDCNYPVSACVTQLMTVLHLQKSYLQLFRGKVWSPDHASLD